MLKDKFFYIKSFFILILASLIIYIGVVFFRPEVIYLSLLKDKEVAGCGREEVLCPDGSYAKQVYPDCQFEKCKPVSTSSDSPLFGRFLLEVPFISEAPQGNWVEPWINACEEASIAMVYFFYKGFKSVEVSPAVDYFIKLFEEEDRLFGSNKNTDSKKILEIISLYGEFGAKIKDFPEIDDIKREIQEGRPVISLHRGFDLKNENISFSPTKSSYHTVVVVGFDDSKMAFITHDPGDKISGDGHFYSYELFMRSLHDYDETRDKADGIPRVIFTFRK